MIGAVARVTYTLGQTQQPVQPIDERRRASDTSDIYRLGSVCVIWRPTLFEGRPTLFEGSPTGVRQRRIRVPFFD
jgi:hypothetical protein